MNACSNDFRNVDRSAAVARLASRGQGAIRDAERRSARHGALHFTPCVEIGWRLSAEYWDRGYATEGTRAALRFGFDALQLREIVALTVPGNVRSRRVMEKIGMVHNPGDDFDHPLVPDGHSLRRHIL